MKLADIPTAVDVIPAKAGTQYHYREFLWAPAFAGVTASQRRHGPEW